MGGWEDGIEVKRVEIKRRKRKGGMGKVGEGMGNGEEGREREERKEEKEGRKERREEESTYIATTSTVLSIAELHLLNSHSNPM